MLTLNRDAVAIFVDRVGNQWIVRDDQGLFLALPVLVVFGMVSPPSNGRTATRCAARKNVKRHE